MEISGFFESIAQLNLSRQKQLFEFLCVNGTVSYNHKDNNDNGDTGECGRTVRTMLPKTFTQ